MNNLFCFIIVFLLSSLGANANETPWLMHTIDNSSQGADGVRLADVNSDGLMDTTTGWEEGGMIRVYINPGYDAAKQPWKFVTVGKVQSPEDAVFVDIDNDGNMDVVSCCEGKTRTVYVHWAPKDKSEYMNDDAWVTEAIPVTQGQQMWMYCQPMQIDGKYGIDLVVGSKGENAAIGWLESPENPRDLSAWNFHPIYDAGWIMSIRLHDMDGDGLSDIVFSDRKGDNRGVKWLQNPQKIDDLKSYWKWHPIGGSDVEVMFLDMEDIDQDSLLDVVAAVYTNQIILMKRTSISVPPHFDVFPIDIPAEAGIGKEVKVGDINLDGQMDIAFTTEKAEQHGVMWITYKEHPTERQWQAHPIADERGIKFDRIELIDLDNDGDLDLLTCEERDNLGVIWYENPTR